MTLNQIELSNLDGDYLLLVESLGQAAYIVVSCNVLAPSPEVFDGSQDALYVFCTLHDCVQAAD